MKTKKNNPLQYKLEVWLDEETNLFWIEWNGDYIQVIPTSNGYKTIWPEKRSKTAHKCVETFSEVNASLLEKALECWNITLSQLALVEFVNEPAPVVVNSTSQAPSGFVLFGKAFFWAVECELNLCASDFLEYLKAGPTSQNKYVATFWDFIRNPANRIQWVKQGRRIYVEESAAHAITCKRDWLGDIVFYRMALAYQPSLQEKAGLAHGE